LAASAAWGISADDVHEHANPGEERRQMMRCTTKTLIRTGQRNR